MTNKKCDGNCCDSLFEDYDDVADDYEIQRLEDIITICEFLIKTRKHRKEKRETFEKLFKDDDEEKKDNVVTQKVPLYVYKYKYPYVPYWNKMWF